VKAKRVLQCALVAAMPLGLVSTYVLAGDNAAAIKEFGVSKGEPIDKGFLFWNYEYVEAPYVVERRGLDILINDKRVFKGPEWPQYDYEVKQDPGDPPDDSLPWDPAPAGVDRRDTYWSRKWRYLAAHHDIEEARKRMVQTYRKSPAIREVRKHPDKEIPEGYVVVGRFGREVNIDLSRFARTSQSREALLAAAEEKRSRWEGALGRGFLFFASAGFECSMGREHARTFLDILVSAADDDEKLRLLEENRLIHGWDADMRKFVIDFKASPQLIERLGVTRLTADEVAREYARPARSGAPGSRKRKLTPDEERARAEQAERGKRWVQRVKERRRWKALDAERDRGQPAPEAAPASPKRSRALEVEQDDGQAVPSRAAHAKSEVVWLVVGLWSLVAVTALVLAVSRSRRMRGASN